jgi:arabinogalactan endo-1,4-beta-galactosidase
MTRSASVFLLFCEGVALLWSIACGGGGSSGGSTPPPVISPPTITKTFGAASVALNGTTTLTFNVSNPNAGSSLSGIAFTDTFPAGLTVTSPNGLNGSCGNGTITATAGSTSVSLSSGTLPANASCSFIVNVSGTTTGTINNVTSSITSTEGGTGLTASANLIVAGPSQQPPEPTDITPVNLDVEYVINQQSGMQVDLNDNSTTAGDHILQQARSFTSLSQRWLFTNLSQGLWQISNFSNDLCFDTASGVGATYLVQNSCAATTATQQWILTSTSNGYYTISNNSSGLLIDVGSSCVAAGVCLDLTQLSGNPKQSQQWLLRPAFFRGIDNALLEKQEAERVSTGLTWWKDSNGQQADVLQILKNHGINMLRLRPTSAPPYSNPSQSSCSGNACYAETDAQDLDLAKRAKNLGMSVELTLFYDGGSSSSVPVSWNGQTLSQLQSSVHDYVKAEILAYRQAGTMPDLVSIGNEVDTGFLGSVGSPTDANFPNFAALQIAGIQGVQDAAADTSIGSAIPPPLTCIHITPAWNLSQFFTLANQNNIPYDAICQSYYPIFHGPLTDAQAASSNPNGQPVEQDVLTAAANALGKPILILETGEHYENGFDSNDPWYAPPSQTLQSQFLADLQGVQHGLPNNLGMGIAYWDAAGVNIPNPAGGFFNGNNQASAIYTWNGLTIFNNADTSGATNVQDPTYSTPLPALDALGKH